jgi:hypothetical protein
MSAGGLYDIVSPPFPTSTLGGSAVPLGRPFKIRNLMATMQFAVTFFNTANFSQTFRFQLYAATLPPIPQGGTISKQTEAPAVFNAVKNAYIDVKLSYPIVTSGTDYVSVTQSRQVPGLPTIPADSLVIWLVNLKPGQPSIPNSAFSSMGFWARMD